MLSHEDNERLVRVGKGTPLGELFRLYWIPFLPSKDLVKDGQPKRIRLLGEDLVAFRDSEGRVGLVDQACPHRGAPSLASSVDLSAGIQYCRMNSPITVPGPTRVNSSLSLPVMMTPLGSWEMHLGGGPHSGAPRTIRIGPTCPAGPSPA